MKLYLTNEDIKNKNVEIVKGEMSSYLTFNKEKRYVYIDGYWILSNYINMFNDYKKFKNYKINDFVGILNNIEKRGF